MKKYNKVVVGFLLAFGFSSSCFSHNTAAISFVDSNGDAVTSSVMRTITLDARPRCHCGESFLNKPPCVTNNKINFGTSQSCKYEILSHSYAFTCVNMPTGKTIPFKKIRDLTKTNGVIDSQSVTVPSQCTSS